MFPQGPVEDFLVFSKYMNYTKAAASLYTTASSLNKRIKGLEDSLGVALVQHRGRNLSLTPAGEHFLKEASRLVGKYQTLVSECQEIQRNSKRNLICAIPFYQEEEGEIYYRIISKLQNESLKGMVTVSYDAPYKTDPYECLRDNSYDIVVLYRLADWAAEAPSDIEVKRIKTAKLVAWCNKSHWLAGLESISFESLAKVEIMTPSDANAPLEEVVSQLCGARGLTPRFRRVGTKSQMDFFFADSDDSVYIIPSGVANDSRIKARTDRVIIPLEDAATCEVYIACLKEQPDNSIDLDTALDEAIEAVLSSLL